MKKIEIHTRIFDKKKNSGQLPKKLKELPVNHPAESTHPFKEQPEEHNIPSFGEPQKMQAYLD